jgi:hypothetical protein
MERVWYSLYGRLLSKGALRLAFFKVKSANGAAGIDGQSVKDFSESLDTDLDRLLFLFRTERNVNKQEPYTRPVRTVL